MAALVWPQWRTAESPHAATTAAPIARAFGAAQRQAANEALTALRSLQSVTTAGVTYRDYAPRVLERVFFPLKFSVPAPIVMPAIDRHGAGRPNELTSAVANKILAVARTGARLELCAATAGITRRTLGNWLTRSDHPAFAHFQRYFAEAGSL